MNLFTQSKTLHQFGSVAAGNTATLSLPLGKTYTDLLVSCGGMTMDDIGEIRVMINGDPIDRYRSAQQLIDFNEYRGLDTTNGILHLPFIRPRLYARGQRGISAIGIGTGVFDANGKVKPETVVKIQTLSIEIDIKETATAPTLSATALSEPARVNQLVRRTRHWSKNVPNGGLYEINDLPRGEVVERIYFRGINENGNVIKIRSVEIMMNSTVQFQRTKEINDHIIKNGKVRKVNPDYFVVDFTEHGFGSDGMATRGLQELRVIIDTASPCVVETSVEYFGRLQQK